VTERFQREHDFQMARDIAENANRAKDKLLATLSHDLRTPLSSILGWIRLIRTRSLDSDMMAKGLKSIENNALVQVQLINEILDTSRIASGKVEIITETADLVEIVAAGI